MKLKSEHDNVVNDAFTLHSQFINSPSWFNTLNKAADRKLYSLSKRVALSLHKLDPLAVSKWNLRQ